MKDGDFWIKTLMLQRHPEGGYFLETYRSEEIIPLSCLPQRYPGPRSILTAIYFLLTENEFSAFHRLRSDEVWSFIDGGSLTLHIIDERAEYSICLLGLDPEKGERPQTTVKKGCWFGATINEGSYALVGCIMSPGFDYGDFELGMREKMLKAYPQHKEIIERLTRG